MGQVSIGRFGLVGEGVDGAPVTVTRWVRDGSRVSCGGWITGADAPRDDWDAARAQRDRLLGLVDNPDEPAVPVVWTSDMSQAGYYRVLSVSAPWDLALSLAAHETPAFQWSAELELVASPAMHEMLSRGTVRTNAHTIVAGDVRAFHCVPDVSVGYAPGAASLGVNTIAAADGLEVRRYDDGTPVAPHFFNARQHWFLNPGSYYDGQCTILASNAAASTWADAPNYSVVGRNYGSTDVADVDDWTIGNGLVRVNQSGTGDMAFNWWNPATLAWNEKVFALGGDNIDFDQNPSSVSIVRNHPDLSTIRFTIDSSAVTSVVDSVTVDLTVRRGSRIVEVYVRNDSAITAKWQVRVTPNEGTSSMTGGRYATSNDASTNQFVLLCPVAFTDVTTGDGIALNAAATSGTFGIGNAIGGTGAADPWRTTDLRDEFYAVLGQRSWISRP